jgi:hypothetical protein
MVWPYVLMLPSGQLIVFRYCIPTDSARPLLASEVNFFNTCGTGKGKSSFVLEVISIECRIYYVVPVIAVFTKYDGLVTIACSSLLQDISYEDMDLAMEKAMEAAPSRAGSDLKAHYLTPLYKAQYPPKANVCLQGKFSELVCCDSAAFDGLF